MHEHAKMSSIVRTSQIMSEAKMPAYGDDLAYIHHTAFGGFARDAAPGILTMLRRAKISSGLVVDLGCGSGIWARELLNAGFDVFGVDISESMIRLARRNAPGAKFTCASLLDIEIPSCVAVTALGECVNYAFDRKNSARALARLFRRVHAALQTGGLFIFDAAGPGRLGSPSPVRRWAEGADWTIVMHAEEDPQKMLLTRRIVSFRRAGRLYRRSEEFHKLNLYAPEELRSMLRQAGFRARTLRGYGTCRLPQGHTAFIASANASGVLPSRSPA
jgi:SAM-dependent methyltransferase